MSSSRRWSFVLVLALATAPRLAWYRSHQPDLPPDSYGYLNVAREWRSERAPKDGWDDRSQLPWDNQGARLPGYPLFLDLVFIAASHFPTPDAALAAPRRVLLPGTEVRRWHFQHLQTDENVRAVQAAQHILGVAATGVAFMTIVSWSGSVLAGIVGALVAIGWNPVWIVTYEPSVMGEVLAGVVLVVIVWLLSARSVSPLREHLAAALCGMAVGIRPPMVLAALPTLAFLVWKRRGDGPAAFTVLIAPLVVVALLIVNNGVRYRYWGLGSAGGGPPIPPVAAPPGGVRATLAGGGLKLRGNQFGGQVLLYQLSVEDHRPYLDVAREVGRAASTYILDHPLWYAGSVAEAVADFFSPPLRLVPGELNVVRKRFPMLWLALGGSSVDLSLRGFCGLFMRGPDAVKLGPVIFIVSGIGLALVAHTENRRFPAPIVPLVLVSGV